MGISSNPYLGSEPRPEGKRTPAATEARFLPRIDRSRTLEGKQGFQAELGHFDEHTSQVGSELCSAPMMKQVRCCSTNASTYEKLRALFYPLWPTRLRKEGCWLLQSTSRALYISTIEFSHHHVNVCVVKEGSLKPYLTRRILLLTYGYYVTPAQSSIMVSEH